MQRIKLYVHARGLAHYKYVITIYYQKAQIFDYYYYQKAYVVHRYGLGIDDFFVYTKKDQRT